MAILHQRRWISRREITFIDKITGLVRDALLNKTKAYFIGLLDTPAMRTKYTAVPVAIMVTYSRHCPFNWLGSLEVDSILAVKEGCAAGIQTHCWSSL